MPTRTSITQPRTRIWSPYGLNMLRDKPVHSFFCSEQAGATVFKDHGLAKYDAVPHGNLVYGHASLVSKDARTSMSTLDSTGYAVATLHPAVSKSISLSVDAVVLLPDALRSGAFLFLGDNSSSHFGLGFGIGGTSIRNIAGAFPGIDAVGGYQQMYGTALTVGTPQHVGYTIDASGNLLFYINGINVGGSFTHSASWTPINSLYLFQDYSGIPPAGASYPFKYYAQYISIYSYVLSGVQMLSHASYV